MTYYEENDNNWKRHQVMQMIESVDKDIKTITVTIFHMSKE